MSSVSGQTTERVLSNTRLKLAGAYRFNGVGVFAPWRARILTFNITTPCERSRPQLKRNPLGSGQYEETMRENLSYFALAITTLLSGCGTQDRANSRPPVDSPATTVSANAGARSAILAACDTVGSWLRALAPTASHDQGSVPFDRHIPGAVGQGCTSSARGREQAGHSIYHAVLDSAKAHEWSEGVVIACGPDGSLTAIRRGEVVCGMSGTWDGGDDADSTYVPSDTIEVLAACFRFDTITSQQF
jgi:hypothetical protein